MKYAYLLIDLVSISVPFIFSFHPKLQFYKEWKNYAIANIIMAAVFIIWDIWFTEMGVWGFNPDYLTGFEFFNLPIEEVLFFICIPFASTFMYHVFTKFVHKKGLSKSGKIFISAWAIVLIVIALINLDKAYTSITFLATACWLLSITLLEKQKYQFSFFINSLFVLIPFFIVNGILTGSWIENQIVWYNNNENLGIRLATIPIEDTMYGLLMLGMLVTIFEKLKKQ